MEILLKKTPIKNNGTLVPSPKERPSIAPINALWLRITLAKNEYTIMQGKNPFNTPKKYSPRMF